jgi:hypothetical protein
MTNFEALKNLNDEELAHILDQIFCAGYNAGHNSIAIKTIDDTNPFDLEWLRKPAETATVSPFCDDGDYTLLEGLTALLLPIVEYKPSESNEPLEWFSEIVLPKKCSDDSEEE